MQIKLFVENLLGSLRTAGALLIGNSYLVYTGVIGSNPKVSFQIFIVGLSLALVTSVPWTVWLSKK